MAKHLKRIADWRKRAESAKYNWEALKSACGGNAKQLTRQAYNEFDMTALQWLRKARLARSKELLLAGKAPKEVADEVGYAKVQNFYLFFKKATGVSPLEFVRQNSPPPPPQS